MARHAGRHASAAAPLADGSAARAANAPDPRLAGPRRLHHGSIQMPNVTSYSGSWLVWFAERQPRAGSTAARYASPVPLRKVDPKYYRGRSRTEVEGTVRLFAVIRKDGQRGFRRTAAPPGRPRLDRSAEDALAKWHFEPAKRDGVPVDVDAVFEIPFHLAPRLTR